MATHRERVVRGRTSGAEMDPTKPGKKSTTQDNAKPTKTAARSTPVAKMHPARFGDTSRLVDLEDINDKDDSLQLRFSTNGADLREHLEQAGQLRAIDLRAPKPYSIIDGFRRVQVAKALGWSRIAAFVYENLSDDEAWRMSFSRNVARRNLSPLERANAMAMAMARGETKTGLGYLFGISTRQVERYLNILDLPEPLRAILDGKVVNMAHVRALHEYGVLDGKKWRKRIAAENLDAAALRKILSKEVGNHQGGRPRKFLSRDDNSLRLHSFYIARTAPLAHRQAAIAALEEALEWLKGTQDCENKDAT